MDFKDYYATLGVPKTGLRQGDQAGLPPAGAQAPPGREPGDKPPRPSSRRSTRPTRCSATPRSAQEVRRARRQLADVRAGRRARAQPVRRRRRPAVGAGAAAAAATARCRQEEMQEMFGDGNPFSDFFTTFFGGGGGRRRRGRAAAAADPPAPGRDVEHEIELARGGLSRHDAPAGAQARRHARTVEVRIPRQA